MTEMTSSEFKEAVESLLGFGAQRKFARILGRDETTVRRWVSGARRLPPEIPLILAMMWERRRMGLPMEINVPSELHAVIANEMKREEYERENLNEVVERLNRPSSGDDQSLDRPDA